MPKRKEKGDKGEQAFNLWLQKEGLNYLYINQDKISQATLFPQNVKRPDFFLLIEAIGMIAIDVKYKKEFTLDYETDLKMPIAFERIFHMPVWFAFMQEDGRLWRWISALKAIEVGERLTNKSGKDFVALKPHDLIDIATGEDLSKLYTQRFQSLENIKEFPKKPVCRQASTDA